MKYKKSIKNIKKKLLTGFAIALTALFASVPAVDAFAADTVSSESSELEALRIKKEAAQAAYDAALADKLMAEDEVENARIALKDAQDNYEDVRERYATGFTGFLQWVIETEDDPVKAEDARRVLEEAFAGEQQISADDPANITRMLYMADWLEELAEYFRSNYGVEADTSHAAMRLAQSGFGEYQSEYDLEKAYDKVTFENERISATQNEGVFKGFWYTYTHLANAQQEGMPLLEGLPKRVGDNYFCNYHGDMIRSDRGYDDGKYFNYVLEDGEEFNYGSYCRYIENCRAEGKLPSWKREYNWVYVANHGQYPLSWGSEQYRFVSDEEKAEMRENQNIIIEHTYLAYRFNFDSIFDFLLYVFNYSKGITIGYALGVNEPLSGFEEGDNNILGVVFNGKGTYTIDEYVRALREYYSMTDPVAAKAYLASRNDDYDNAQRQLAGAEGLLATAYGTLKGAEKEYEEAAAGFTGLIEVPVNEGVASEAEELIAGEATSYANEVSVSQQTAFAGDHYSEAETATGSVLPEAQHITEQSPVGAEAQELQAAQATAKEDGQEVTVSREETLQNSLSAEEQEAQATAKEEGQEAILSREDTFAESVLTSGGAASETPATEAAAYSESAAIDAPEKEAGLQTSSEKDKQKNGVLAEVLSYIFNGGAIAFIIPAGFRRKKKTGEMLQGEC